MMTAFAAIATVVFIHGSGAAYRQWEDTGQEAYGWLSLFYLALGAFGIYALIVGK